MLRASLAGSQIIGMAMARYSVEVDRGGKARPFGSKINDP